MYKIIDSEGRELGITEQPYYIRLAANGSFAPCGEKDAQGVAVNGTPYHLLGREELPGLPTVVAVPMDSGSYFFNNQEDMKSQLQQADDTAIELYEANMAQEKINAAQDDALIEIYELIGG